MSDNLKKYLAVTFAASCLTACVNLAPVPTGDIQRYTLSYSSPTNPMTLPTHKAIMLGVGEAAPGLRSEKMAYQQIDYQLKYYALNRWLAPPATLIMPLFADALSNTGAFKAVISAPVYAGDVDTHVNVDLLSLQQNFTSATTSEEKLVLQVVIVDASHNKLIAAKRFVAEVSAAPNPEGGVVAANQALSKLMPQMVNFVIEKTK